MRRIKCTLGGAITLSRDELDSWHEGHRITALVGSSGSGKTAIAKSIATGVAEIGHAIWLSAADLNLNSLSEQFSCLEIRHRFPELIAATIDRGLIVIDQVERLDESGLKNLAVLLQLARVDGESTPWRLLLTCVADYWGNTSLALKREFGSGLDVDIQTIEFHFEKHRASVLETFPNMARVLQRPILWPLFGNLKILDLVLSNANEHTDATSWVGESDVLDWYWSQHVQTGPNSLARSRLLQKLAGIEADQFLTGVPIDMFDSDECRIAQELEQDDLLRAGEERLGFEHDLFGDWARTRLLISRQHEVDHIIRENAFNPRWHRAVRLYALRLLEDQQDNGERWYELLCDLSTDDELKIEGDLVLESVVFASNAESFLEKAWDRLVENRGARLTRLLTRFLYVATFPDPRYATLSDDVAAETFHRVPFWPLWLPLLRILHEKRTDATSLATNKATEIADLWLRSSGSNWPLRDEAAQMLIAAAHHVIQEIGEKDRWASHEDTHEAVFCRLLTAATVHPDETAELSLSLVERGDQSLFLIAEGSEPDDEIAAGSELTGLFDRSRSLPDPWPDGPRRRVNQVVQKGFLASSSPLQFLFSVRPDAAKEVLLALVIREPLPPDLQGYHSPLDEFLHVDEAHDWTPGMFFHGPFLPFLQLNEEKGIETIVSLINFVTDRWAENHDPSPAIYATIGDHLIEYRGSDDAYYWYRDSVHSPQVVVSPLMALEKWLYLCLENGKPLAPAVSQLLRTSRSTAVLGVLAAVGRKEPRLFIDVLRPLVAIWRLQTWEEEHRIRHSDTVTGLIMMQWSRWGEQIFNLVRDWHVLEHRNSTLGDVLLKLFMTNQQFRTLMQHIRTAWCRELERLTDSDDRDVLERIVLQFDEDNWQGRRTDQGIAVEFVEPEERSQRLALVREETERRMNALAFPVTCRELIDKQTKMTDVEIEEFWRSLCAIADNADTLRKEGEAPEHGIMGGIAVLVLLHEDWLESQPEREDWCWQQFNEILEAPPPHPQFHFEDSVSDYFWNNFAGMLVPRMLAAAPKDYGVRSLCAEFALAFNHSVIKDVMNAAFAVREEIGDDFRRLQHLVIASSGLRNIKMVTHGGNSIWSCPDVEFDIDTQLIDLRDQFARSETPLDLPALANVGKESTATIANMVDQQREISSKEPVPENVQALVAKRIERGRGFEPMQLRAGFGWLENIEAANSKEELAAWVATLENLLHGVLRPLGGVEEALFDDQDTNSFFAAPSQWDTWIFELIASIIPKIDASEEAYRLWQPILAMGLDRMHWVDSFVSAWFIHGLRAMDCEQNFFREWKAMIEFAWSRDNWRQTKIRSYGSEEELFRNLMGFSSLGHGFLEDERYRSHITGMRTEYERWADAFLPHPEATRAFANFLTFPSSTDYLREGVGRLAEASSQFKAWHWQEFYHLDRALLKLLEYDWRENSRLIVRDAKVRRDFSTILKTMTDRQIPKALALQDKMLRAT